MNKAFWKEAVVYQIYPRSFKDSNGDGVGDLRGIISKLDYLQDLGVNVVWLSPVYQSPNDDNGYDISHYQAIMDEFGTIADWEEMLAEMHKRDIKLIMDLVVNHSSDEHDWFVKSRQSKDNNPYRDYYIWRPGKDDREPNNWVSVFSGSAWEWDEQSGEYFLHVFSKKQPDLNWDNPKLRQEIYDMMTWWLDKGIDGFRMDVINFISKVPELPDAGTDRYAWGGEYFMNGPRIHEYLQEMNREVLSKYDVMTVGEMPGVTADEAKLYTGKDRKELQMVFQFEHMDIGSGTGGKWDLAPWTLGQLRGILHKWQVGLANDGWNSLYLNNHDQPRMVSRFGDDGEYRSVSAKMLATLLHTLKGTPYIYQGEEIGMTNVKFDSIDRYKDIETLNMYRDATTQQGKSNEQVMESIYVKGRDNARTPMQWDATDNGGFTTGTPWIETNPNYSTINAEQAVQDPQSIYAYYKELIALRKRHEVMVYGDYELYLEDHDSIYSYTRKLGEEIWLVILNFFKEPVTFDLPTQLSHDTRELIISNYEVDSAESIASVNLRPYEARVYRLHGVQ
ncbi:glycoside hydrolase family 13 protein [Cohnella mopanensis]|uniref:glycoside hydrolase family 13 protein n=1 Tax=Cohnella mopanensis TaxID=2911966 RepID=UPI001EF896C9|nr:alpha-glucosidase [Cohnella mopanensis]